MNSKNTENKARFLGIYEKAINNKFDWATKINIAKAAGFDFIEFSIDESDFRLERLDWSNTQINELRELLIKKDFYFNSMCLSAHRRYPFGSKDPKIRAKALEIMQKALILAKKLGIRTIQLAAYDVYYEKSNETTKANFVKGMQLAAKLAQKYSITLAFETMDTPFAGTISKCLSFLKQINSPLFYIYPDLGNLNQFTPDIENEIFLGKDKIIAFHFKDTLPNKFKEVPWGKGSVNFVRSLKAIKKNDLNVPILIEMWSKNQPNETIDENIALLKQAKEFYHTQWKRAKGE
ncbi:L-ribulose-5-phosphate 3-epimerase [Mycoplasmopsis mustelae]|uniref:L-ribulose-5-phosphate 3-epimerase n=1 Tax=Mycoplasmopsis mustelae TaxID=171289 RepID=A0A4R7UE36_9BACT|nr:L-ribulose-5-phosphate 3-epimerase [Mycoplasmopsis mustelae]TDV24191.1 L-ribulose-5-phosphate 3-epimerase [Mycoplasmopsis mustelae]